MTILLTGATGLVGQRLLPRLLRAGVACRALVRGSKPVPRGTAVFDGDLLQAGTLRAAAEGVTAIVHLAALLRTPKAGDIWKVNLEGTQNLIEAAKAVAPAARFIMASTGLVYDVASQRPAREDDLCDPKQPYPASKIAAENALRDSGLNWSIQRYGFVYGDGDGHVAAIPRLAQVFGWHPANRLSLIHHLDVAGAMQLALAGTFDRLTVNIVDDAPTTVFELASVAQQSLEPSAEPLRNPWSGHLDGALARGLGWQPLVRTIHQAVSEALL